MAGDVTEYTSGGVRVRITGAGDVARKFERAAADSQDMRPLMHRLGQIVADAAHAPVRTGRTAATTRAGHGKTKAVVRSGGARTPGAGVTHYGWPARNIRAQPWLTDALHARQGAVYTALERGMQDLINTNNLA